MTERELNEAVARKLADGPGLVNIEAYKAIGTYAPPPYSTDIKAAWELVEQKGLAWQIFKYLDGSAGAVVHDGAVAGQGQGASAPLAICRAFLELPVKL